MKELWSRCLIVAYGEVDDGAFPSLAVGSAKLLFEDLWNQAWELDPSEAQKKIAEILPEKNLFLKHYQKLLIASVRAPSLENSSKSAQKKNSSRSRSAKISGSIRFDDL
jgi:hypothetical protein